MESMDIMPFATVLTISLGRQHAAYKALSLQKKIFLWLFSRLSGSVGVKSRFNRYFRELLFLSKLQIGNIFSHFQKDVFCIFKFCITEEISTVEFSFVV